MDFQKKKKSQKAETAAFHLEQRQIDEIQMKKLNSANRMYRKCTSGKCPTNDSNDSIDDWSETKTQEEDRVDPKVEEELKKIWSQKGRSHRLRDLQLEIAELETQLEIASSKQYIESREKDFTLIRERIEGIKRKEEEIGKTKMEISHLKSQLVRLDQKQVELSQQTESEGE